MRNAGVEAAVAQKAGAIVLHEINPELVSVPLEEAVTAGIPIFVRQFVDHFQKGRQESRCQEISTAPPARARAFLDFFVNTVASKHEAQSFAHESIRTTG
jgi:hypothetical protein